MGVLHRSKFEAMLGWNENTPSHISSKNGFDELVRESRGLFGPHAHGGQLVHDRDPNQIPQGEQPPRPLATRWPDWPQKLPVEPANQ